jgi:hypothetical protein
MRRVNDFYPTPEWATKELMRVVPAQGRILECCAGEGDIAKVLNQQHGVDVFSNDIDSHAPCLDHFDATIKTNWERWAGWADWVVTNPPFNQAAQIVPLAYEHARVGIAMLLRLSYLEPVEDRGAWLNEHPPTKLIVLPRISFTGNGKTDSVTCASMIWKKNGMGQQIIVAENPRFATKTEKLFAQTA